MVVEDMDDTRELYATELERAGFIVERVQDGEAALELMAEFEPDIVVLDLMLPRVNGFAVAAALRAREKRPGKIKILAVTGLNSDPMRRVALEAGCDAVLWKPVEASVVIDEAERLLKSRERSRNQDR